MLAGSLVAFAPAAQAATPPWEPDGNARGAIVFYDASGHVVTGGSIDDSPVAAYVQATVPGRSVDNTATLFGYLAQPGVNPGAWRGEQMTAGNTYPVSTAPPPLNSSPNPTVAAQPGEESMRTLQTDFPHPATDAGTPYDGVYQIRIFTSGASGADPLYFRADVQITGNTWTQIYPPPTTPPQNTTTTLTVTPASPQTPGTTVNLSAAVTPSIATGTVQFKDGAANLGPGVSVTAGTATTSTNTLTAGSHTLSAVFTPTDPTLYNSSTSNTVPYTITAPASTDLAITKTGPATVTGGGPISYALTATNNGPDPATGVTVSDPLPAGVGFVSASSSVGTCTNASGTVTCAIGNLASAGTATIMIDATAPATAGTVTNTATVSGNETDPNPANNTASASTQVGGSTGGSADLSITKYAFSGDFWHSGFQVGNAFYYVLKVKNAGPSTATGVVVSDHLPTGLVVSHVFTTQGTCSKAAGTVTCNLGTLKSGRVALVTIRVTPSIAGSVTNTATVAGNQPDPNMANNSSSVTITVAKAQCDGEDGDCMENGGWTPLLGGLLGALGRH
jgi:uncharacterized repeat protein (TIGR01451 family)